METTQHAYRDLKIAFLAVEEFIRDEDIASFDDLAEKMKDKMNAFLTSFYNKILNIADASQTQIVASLSSADLASLRVTAVPTQAVGVQATQAVGVQAAPAPVTAAQAVVNSTVPIYGDQAATVPDDQPGYSAVTLPL